MLKIKCSNNKEVGVIECFYTCLQEDVNNIVNLIRLFNSQNMYFDLAVLPKHKQSFIEKIKTIDSTINISYSLRKSRGNIKCCGSANFLAELLILFAKYCINDSVFFEPRNLSWEQYLIDGTFEDCFYKYKTANVMFILDSNNNCLRLNFALDIYKTEEVNHKLSFIKYEDK